MEQSSRRVYRAGKDYLIGGVCAGLADYFKIDVTLLRIAWLIFTLINGIGAVAYLICLLIIPRNPEHEKLPAEERTRADNAMLFVGIGIVFIGLMMTFHNLFRIFWWNFDWWFQFPWIPWRVVWPVLIILIGVWFIFQGNRESGDKAHSGQLVRDTENKKIGGVCAGLAAYWNVDVTLVRIAFILLTLFTAFWLGITAYIVMMFVVPEKQAEPPEEAKPERRTATRKNDAEKGGSDE